MRAILVILTAAVMATQSYAVELLMVERTGCHYCDEWLEKIGPIYPKTSEGEFAPLRMANIDDSKPEDVSYARPVVFTPTFILLEEGQELARIEGYPGEDFFWGLLVMMLTEHTDYTADAVPLETN